jgi:hypothetical protein
LLLIPHPLSLVVERHAPFASPVDLDVGGVQVDRDLLAQRRGPLGGQQREHPRVDVTDPGLHRPPLPVGEPARQPGRGRGGQPGHRRQLLPGHVGAVAVQPDQELLSGQLRTRHPDQQLRPGEPAVAGLDRPDRVSNSVIMFRRSISSVTATIPENRVSLTSGAPMRTIRRNRRISRTLPTPIGVLPPAMIVSSQTPSPQVSRAPIVMSRAVSPLLADSGLT